MQALHRPFTRKAIIKKTNLPKIDGFFEKQGIENFQNKSKILLISNDNS